MKKQCSCHNPPEQATAWEEEIMQDTDYLWILSQINPFCSSQEYIERLNRFIAKEKAKSGIEQLEWLLKHASGGGSWRRVAIQGIEHLKKLTEK